MRYDSYSPWRRLRQLREDMDRMFAGFERPRAALFPPVNVWSGPEGVLVTAELPGVDPSKLEITAMRDSLTIQGERETVPEEEGRTWHRRERRTGAFSRTIELPYAVDAESVDASCRDGVLRIGLKRPEADKPRRIEVKAV